ncbi:hypothetical protein P280DRAFT_55916 [Massarina eburnea CBS 473.64]|uniref:Low temperature requirement A n=1 Tax=Massarina eburnea CBS 473.64 TaxID=1395130 RepID=A0A6A6RVK1_9PLEO|nr:hypothetical protein P280DRAFT_55916 [Massarina eburnea CBS 473.64]
MGWAIHNQKKRGVDAEKHLKRLHKNTPFIESPLEGADHDSLVFSQRHEANTTELFFDLFFVANLATFTTYHSITDHTYLIAYIGFFGILWSTWFHVTLHDVRFARDSLYERVCKTVQFVTFVGLALVGSGFNPNSTTVNNTNFRILCYTLLISRILLAIQYTVVLFYVMRARFTKLYFPLGLTIAVYLTAGVIFGAMTPAFKKGDKAKHSIYVVWYIVMFVESIAVVGISCIYRMLSFKKTHLMERMSLLTLIVIGEGAIGTTKTVSRLMGKSGLNVEGCFLIMCIIGILVLVWALYFDKFPHGHYGTIRQQIWSLLHFPFQLAIVGLLEGCQQVALARYVIKNWEKIDHYRAVYCLEDHLDGSKLRDKLASLVNYWGFTAKYETLAFQNLTMEAVYKIGNTSDICSESNAKEYEETGIWPTEFAQLTQQMFDGVYIGLGMKLPVSKLEHETAQDIAIRSWRIVYIYYWASFCLLVACSIVFLVLIRRHRADLFDFVSITSRLVVLVIGGVLIGLVANYNALYAFLRSPAVLPVCLVLLFLILLFDKLSAAISNVHTKNSGEPYALEYQKDDHHGAGGGVGVAHGHVEQVADVAHGHHASRRRHKATRTKPEAQRSRSKDHSHRSRSKSDGHRSRSNVDGHRHHRKHEPSRERSRSPSLHPGMGHHGGYPPAQGYGQHYGA